MLIKHANMKTVTLLLCCLAALYPGIALSVNSSANTEDVYLRLERSQDSELDLRITSMGGFGINVGKIGHIDISHIESSANGDALVLDLGADLSFKAGVTFFFGVGIMLGYNWDSSSYISAYYPEVGVITSLSRTLGIVVTKKRFYNLYDNIEGEDVIMFGLLISDR